MRVVLLCVFLFTPLLATGQFRKGPHKVVGADFFRGAIYEHKEQVSHLVTDHPWGVRITFDQQTTGSEAWETRYNYPDVGLTFIYLDYNNPVLGQSIALIPHYQFYIGKNRASRSQFNYKIGLGLAYNTEKYDPEENNKNNVLSTDLSFGILFQAGYQFAITQRTYLVSSVAMTHFSNGSIKKPNSGINVFALNLGMSYRLDSGPIEYLPNTETPFRKPPVGFTVALSSGMHEAVRVGSGADPFFVLSGLVDKQLNRKSIFGIGLEWFYSVSLKKIRKYDYWLEDGENPDFKRVGLVISHELLLNRLSLITQAGYYLYDPYSKFSTTYLRAGLRRYFGKKIFGSIAVKSHAARAEAAEFAIGYRIK